jgi:glutamyl-tRNA synthetase
VAKTLRGRYAPSPSGPLHLGNARTALLAWLWTRSEGGSFVMRVEDLDPTRCRPEHERGQLAQLRWLGLDWDEGPDVGGACGPYRQSERGDVYEDALARLATYRCTCTRAELRAMAGAPHGQEPRYDGRCRAGGARRDGRPAATRWRVPEGEASAVEFVDDLAGRQREVVSDVVGDPALRRWDGAWAYQLAVVVDDARMGIGRVVRGADLLASTARQILLARALGLEPPRRWAHVPLLLDREGRRLSKRERAADLGALMERRVDARRVVAWLAATCGLVGPEVTHVTPRELLPAFEPRRIDLEAASRIPAPPALDHPERHGA